MIPNFGAPKDSQFTPSKRPLAVVRIVPGELGLSSDTAIVCAWCPDKKEADAWAMSQKLRVSHGVCAACKQAALAGVSK